MYDPKHLRRTSRVFATGFVFVALLGGCAVDTDPSTSEDALEAASSTCNIEPHAPDAPLKLLTPPITSADDAETRFGCLQNILRIQDDRRAPFATLYSQITVAVRAAIKAGRFEDNAWAARYLTSFADLYRASFIGWASGHGDQIPGAWRIAFDAAKERRALIVQHVALGVNAHVDRDLSHALVAAGLGDGADREKHKRDHFLVNDILSENLDSSLHDLAATYAPGLGEAPADILDVVEKTYFLAIKAGRFKAWEDAVALQESGLLHGVVEGEIEFTSKVVADAILAPNVFSPLLAQLHELEGTE